MFLSVITPSAISVFKCCTAVLLDFTSCVIVLFKVIICELFIAVAWEEAKACVLLLEIIVPAVFGTNNILLDFKNYPSGSYIINVSDDNNQIVDKQTIIKE